MPITLFEASVPVFTRYLRQLAGLVAQAEHYARLHALEPQTVLQARLAPDMLPFAVQVEIAVNFVFRACAPLAGKPLAPLGEHRASFAALQTRIAQAQLFLTTLTPADMQGSEDRFITDPAGQAEVTLEGTAFLLQYALPNFFFHVTTAYAVLRHLGVPLSKAQFDGWHVYAAQV
jgi:hypothetical protein